MVVPESWKRLFAGFGLSLKWLEDIDKEDNRNAQETPETAVKRQEKPHESQPEEAPQKPLDSLDERRSWSTKPCPFCRQGVLTFVKSTIATNSKFDGTHIQLRCDYCGASGPVAGSHDKAVEKWNAWWKDEEHVELPKNDQPMWFSMTERSIPRPSKTRKSSTAMAGRWRSR